MIDLKWKMKGGVVLAWQCYLCGRWMAQDVNVPGVAVMARTQGVTEGQGGELGKVPGFYVCGSHAALLGPMREEQGAAS